MISRNVALVYHFFAQYRRPVLEELLTHSQHRFVLCADSKNSLMPGLPVWTPPDPQRFRRCRTFSIGGHLVWQSGLLSLAGDRNLDAVIYLGDWKWPSTWLAACLSRLRGQRVLFWTHGWRRPDRGPVRILRRTFYRLAHGLLLYGNEARRIGLREGFASRDLYVVYNSVAAQPPGGEVPAMSREQRRELRSALFPGSDADTPVVCCSSRLSSRRRLDLLLDAAAELAAQGHPVNVLLIGDGPERAKLEARARRLGLRVSFVGACFDEQRLAEYFAISSVTVSPGDIGLTAVHSMLHGVPVVSHADLEQQGPEAEAIVPGETGDLFRRGDLAHLVSVIRSWTQTPFVEEHVSRACRALIRRRYSPVVQRRVIDAAIAGVGADDVAALIEESWRRAGP